MARLIAGLAALLTALCLASDVWAHATLVSAEPADGSVLAQPPKMVQLQFNESVTPAVIGLIDAGGKTREVATRAVGQSVLMVLPDDLPQGTQVVSYRVVSQDGHPVAGSLVFSIGVVTVGAPPVDAKPLTVLIWLARIGVYVGLFAGVGGAFFAAWIGQGPAGSTVSRGALAVGVFSAIASLGLQGLDLLDLPFSAIVTSAPWTSALATSLGPSLLIAIAVMAIAWFAWKSPSMTIAWVLAMLAMAGVGLSLATSGHAATASPQWLTRPSSFLHGVAVAYWIGAFVPLAAMARRRDNELPRVLHQFSAIAVPVVGLLVLTGLALAIIQLGESSRADRDPIRHHPLDQTDAGGPAAWTCRAEPVLFSRPHSCRVRRTRGHCCDRSCSNAPWRSASSPWSPAGASRRRRGCWLPPRRAAVDSYPHRAGDVSGADFAGQGGLGRFCAAVDDGRRSSAARQGSNARREPAGARYRTDGTSRERSDRTATGTCAASCCRCAGRWQMRIDALVTDFEKVTLEDQFEVR